MSRNRVSSTSPVGPLFLFMPDGVLVNFHAVPADDIDMMNAATFLA